MRGVEGVAVGVASEVGAASAPELVERRREDTTARTVDEGCVADGGVVGASGKGSRR
jgi:hypothetical protein